MCHIIPRCFKIPAEIGLFVGNIYSRRQQQVRFIKFLHVFCTNTYRLSVSLYLFLCRVCEKKVFLRIRDFFSTFKTEYISSMPKEEETTEKKRTEERQVINLLVTCSEGVMFLIGSNPSC